MPPLLDAPGSSKDHFPSGRDNSATTTSSRQKEEDGVGTGSVCPECPLTTTTDDVANSAAAAEAEAYVPSMGRLSLYEQRELARQTKNAAWTSYRRCSSGPTSTATRSANYCAKAPQSSPLMISTPTTNLPPRLDRNREALFSTLMNATKITTLPRKRTSCINSTTVPHPATTSNKSTTTILSKSKKEDLRKLLLNNNNHKQRQNSSGANKKKSLAAEILEKTGSSSTRI